MKYFCKDWLDISQYPSKDCRDAKVWAWEFLRRNHSYQECWSRVKKSNGKFDEDVAREIRDDFCIRRPVDPLSEDELPEFISGNIRAFTNPVPLGTKAKARIPNSINDHEMLILFDLSVSVPFQLEQAKRSLEERKSRLKRMDVVDDNSTRNPYKKFQDYLRILDAKQGGVKHKTIAKELFPKIKNEYPDMRGDEAVKQNYRKAKTLRDKNFKFIFLRLNQS